MLFDIISGVGEVLLLGTIYRCEGVIYAAEKPDTSLSLQIVGCRVDVTSLGKWEEKDSTMKVVFCLYIEG